MKVKFIGTGGVFDYEFGNSSLTIDSDQRVLVDCGPLVFPRLLDLEITDTIEYLLLTHLHGDHVGSLFQLVFYMNGRLNKRLKVLCATERFQREIETLLSAQGVPRTYFEVHPLSTVPWIEAIDTTGRHAVGFTSFGYLFYDGSDRVYLSGDLGDIDVSKQVLKGLPRDGLTVFHEMHHKTSKAHVHYSELSDLVDDVPIFGYHCNPNLIPADNRIPLVANHPDLLW